MLEASSPPLRVAFLEVLRRHLSGPLRVVWDGAPIHRSAGVRDFADGTSGRQMLERLPASAPEINPVESLWEQLKQHELGNLSSVTSTNTASRQGRPAPTPPPPKDHRRLLKQFSLSL